MRRIRRKYINILIEYDVFEDINEIYLDENSMREKFEKQIDNLENELTNLNTKSEQS